MPFASERSQEGIDAVFRSWHFASQARPEDEAAETTFLHTREAAVAVVQKSARKGAAPLAGLRRPGAAKREKACKEMSEA